MKPIYSVKDIAVLLCTLILFPGPVWPQQVEQVQQELDLKQLEILQKLDTKDLILNGKLLKQGDKWFVDINELQPNKNLFSEYEQLNQLTLQYWLLRQGCIDCAAKPIPLPEIPYIGETPPIASPIAPPKCQEDEVLLKGVCIKITEILGGN